MLPENRKYHYVGEIVIEQSCVPSELRSPMNDKVNWLFLNLGGQQFSFVYKIENPLEAKYDIPFKIELAFTMIEVVRSLVILNYTYAVLRGPKLIGTIKLIKSID